MSPLPLMNRIDFDAVRPDLLSDLDTNQMVTEILDEVRRDGEMAIRRYAERFEGQVAGTPLLFETSSLKAAAESLPEQTLHLLQRVRERIANFAEAQKSQCLPLSVAVPGGRAGHDYLPMERVGCYVPGGRYPLPSTALMTVVPAVVAGCSAIVMTTPKPSELMLAAAHVAGAHQVLATGGAQGIAALAFGFEGFPKVDFIAGPGNRFVTAAKRLVFGQVGIDMLAGPSELVIVADSSAVPEKLAADLLAQAEHDVDASTILLTCDRQIAEAVRSQLTWQLEKLPTAETARLALRQGAIVLCDDDPQIVGLCNRLAPEHLELHCRNATWFRESVKHAGCLFLGTTTAEVFGDYGMGPNHTLPTGGSARFTAGLNVMTYLRPRTWMELDQEIPRQVIEDVVALARLEGLAGHARAAELRMSPCSPIVKS